MSRTSARRSRRDRARRRRPRRPRVAARATSTARRLRDRRARGTRCGSTSRARRPRARSGNPRPRPAGSRSSAMRVTTASCCASLRPKNAAHGPTIANSFATTVVTPSKWVGRAAPHRSAVRPVDVHRRERRPRVHLGDARREHAVDALGLARLEVAGEVARVAVEVLVGAELQRVHEDRHDHEVGGGRAPPASASGGRRAGSPSSARAPTRRPPARASSQAARRSAIRSTWSIAWPRSVPAPRVRTGGSGTHVIVGAFRDPLTNADDQRVGGRRRAGSPAAWRTSSRRRSSARSRRPVRRATSRASVR